jgi:hypothetical protein
MREVTDFARMTPALRSVVTKNPEVASFATSGLPSAENEKWIVTKYPRPWPGPRSP